MIYTNEISKALEEDAKADAPGADTNELGLFSIK